MELTVLSHDELPIDSEDHIVLVRRHVRSVAERRGFNPFATAAITTAASELARNVWTHAGSGAATIETLQADGRTGLKLVFRDQGPGIVNVNRVMAGGYSTARSLGLGLSGSRRLVDDFSLETVVGRGTVVSVVKWARF